MTWSAQKHQAPVAPPAPLGPTLPLALPERAVHLVKDEEGVQLLEGVLRERHGVGLNKQDGFKQYGLVGAFIYGTFFPFPF